jgi:hypothetical protein
VAVFRINEVQDRGAGGALELGWNPNGAAHAAPPVVVGLVTA